ncbi:hypothetical protein, partial [Intestinimonas sp. HCP28S3_D6]|uniref:hypothetical protein n=1 Tax=Intestinimonas sp. HCP28S3_D6 TaxID=3438942 RepID=UPI003F89D0EC
MAFSEQELITIRQTMINKALQCALSVGMRRTSLEVITETSKEPLNKSLYPVSTQCISRHLRLVKVISVQNSHYLSA